MDEKNLRKSIIKMRDGLDEATLSLSSATITESLFDIRGFADFSSYFVYNSFRGEAPTNEIINRLKSMGKTVLYPLTVGDTMYAVKPEGEKFEKDKFGVYVPEKYSIIDNVDVVIVPLVACDKNLNRIGFGKGYYDRFLRDRQCFKIGICHDFQVVDEIDPKEWDVPLDIIITEKRILRR